MAGFRYRHGFLIPVISIAAAGAMANIIRAMVTGVIGTYDIVTSASYLTGAIVVCYGRRRAYRWITFHSFSGSDHICYWLLLILLRICVVFGFFWSDTLLRIIAGSWFVLTSVRLRLMLIEVRRGNPYIAPIPQEKDFYR